MEVEVKARRIGGSIGIILPKEIVMQERIIEKDIANSLKIKIEKKDNLNFLWGRGKDIKKSTKQIMKEIDEGEDD